MFKRRRNVSFILSLGLSLLSAPVSASSAEFKSEIIYQIMTDRFFDGDPANNNPPQSAGLYDATRTNWRAYWGGDLQGIRQKIEYLACMGVTAIWISPPVDNVNTNLLDATGRPSAPYHAYQARDFKRIEEHFGDANNSWGAFDELVAAAHGHGIKVIVDFAPNHSNFNNLGEYGSLYDDGKFLGDYTNDPNGYFHHQNFIQNRYDRYQVQYYTLYDLADINQENPTMDAYLKASAQLFQQHGADGFRLDGTKHATWGWQYSFANSIYTSGDSFVFGEWYLEDPPALKPEGLLHRFSAFVRGLFYDDPTPKKNTADPLYRDAYKFANKSGISLLDFPLNAATRNVFGAADVDFSEIDSTLAQEARDFERPEDLVTFIDNHDMARLLSLSNNRDRLHEALAFILTARGIPCIYYGTEQYLHDDADGGKDPHNRPMMNSFSMDTAAYALVGQLSTLRHTNPALAYGSMSRRWLNSDVYIYERKFFENVVLVAINKDDAASYEVGGLQTALPQGAYADYLGGQFGGLTLNVNQGTGGDNSVSAFNLPPHSISVWSYRDTAAANPEVGSVSPPVAQPGVRVTIGGANFGSSTGTVLYGEAAAPIISWGATEIKVVVPTISQGIYEVKVINASGQASNPVKFTVLGGKLIPVTFTVDNAPPTKAGDDIFLTGSTVELGNWATGWNVAVGPLVSPQSSVWFICASVPAGQTLGFKFVKRAADGSVTLEAGGNHSYTVPTSGTAEVHVNWQY